MEDNIFKNMKNRNDEYLEKIKHIHALGKIDELADLFDEYGQFLCDSSRTLLMAAKYLESLTDETDEEKQKSKSCIKLFREYYVTLTNTYRKIDESQRKGMIPTNLPIF
jgi:hypothetical protein